ncbi:MAG: trypsin-like peptidase domain-containing protein [Sciscionella sp.]
MSEQSTGNEDPAAGAGRPVVSPRPLERPTVDPAEAALFARPQGAEGAFAPPPAQRQTAVNGALRMSAPPPEALSSAFGRPLDSDEVLQRPPAQAQDVDEPPLWSTKGDADPWRDPGAGAVLGPPAVDAKPDRKHTAARLSGPLLSVPELLFGRRVKPTALLALLLAALLVGGAGGLLGWLVGRGGSGLTDGSVTLAQVDPAIQRAPDSVAAVASRVTPAVVSLEVHAGNLGAVGSGVVIDKNGYVITNNHVVAVGGSAKPTITAVFTDGTRAPAQIVGTDPITDLAVVKVNVTNPTVIQLGKSSDLRVGDPVIAIGSPLGLASTVTSGIVSAKHRAITAAGENGGAPVVYDAIQTDAPINHGNSGGALVDSSGALVGINSAISSSSDNGGSIGLGFAIPIDQARVIAQTLIRSGKVTHASLGVNVRSVSANSSEGAEVANVPPGGAAAKAGIKEGDVITKFGDRLITNAAELHAAVLEHAPGDKAPVRIVRQGVRHTVYVTLGSD